jgi:uncharacterized protein YceH (UPF0502 family)
MGATVHQLPARATGAQLVTKTQLARQLGRSERWVELRAQEGMPRAGLDRGGRRLFDTGVCEKWLAARSEKLSAAEPSSTGDRLVALEHEVAELRAIVNELRGAA